MGIPFEQVFQEFSPEEQAAILSRAEKLIAAELNLRELRRQQKLTQARLSKKLKIGQEGISRIEKRTDLYLSTLRSYVEGVGGKLSLVVEFPNRQPVVLTGLGEITPPAKTKKKTGKNTKSKPGSRRAA
ncbi:MAG: XRE family transcriptional regulator [Terracidiphilus sp.]|nr:XRE family transcriptional regulator [Terracidiphilus sp.]